MTAPHVRFPGLTMVRHSSLILLLSATLCAAWPAGAAARGASQSDANRTAAGNTQFLLFDLTPGATYDVRHNGNNVANASVGLAGSMTYAGVTSVGDRIEFLLRGVVPVSPAAPNGFAATGNSQGCVGLSWDAPDARDYVTDYSLLWGNSPGAYSDSLQIRRLDIVESGNAWTYMRCGFATGTYYFVLRAHNSFDRWSALSFESMTSIGNQSTQGPPPPTNVAVSENPPGCARVAWTPSGDPTVTGYRVYLGDRPRSQAAYIDSIDVGQVGNGSICSLSSNRYYLSVRSRTATGMLSAYSKEVSLQIIGPDLTPPIITQRDPADGATSVPTNAGISFVVSDAGSGVNFASIKARINGQPCQEATAKPTTDGLGYLVQCSAGSLPSSSNVTVEVDAADKADPHNSATFSWSFQTGSSAVNDVDPPTLSSVTPLAGDADVGPKAPIEVSATDAGLGVDFASVVMTVDGVDVEYRVEGTSSSAHIIYEPGTPYEVGKTVNVRIEACDRADPSNCAQPLSFSFTVREAVAANTPGAIVPDGFWAGDASRPLEVRNLPRDWRVRIFDAAGVAIRRFHNGSTDGFTWTWDFTNDNGQRVAPALYLVRVTDAGGAVQNTGRFLVQSQ